MAIRIRGRRWLAGLGGVVVLGGVAVLSSRAKQEPSPPSVPRAGSIEQVPPATRAEADPFPVDPATPTPTFTQALPPNTPAEITPVSMPPQAGAIVATAPKPSISDDPEGSAGEFLERTRKEATEAVQSLSTEAEALRARLARTEAGLRRWQGVLGALDAQAQAASNPPEPPDLTPVIPSSRPPAPDLPDPAGAPIPPAPTEVPKAAR